MAGVVRGGCAGHLRGHHDGVLQRGGADRFGQRAGRRLVEQPPRRISTRCQRRTSWCSPGSVISSLDARSASPGSTPRRAARERNVDEHNGGRIRQKRVCELDGADVPFENVARGYEAPDGRMVVLTQDDLADLPLSSTREITVLGFLDADRVDPVNHDKAYCLGPSNPAAARLYALLRQAMLEAGQVAVARVAIRTRESLAVLRVREDVIVLQTLL
ncbi:Ku protein [Kitasatospora sp. NPDC101235]|uniref:Ku protein n=1 Tax=Kitasatospora sp. NPDC101235 TaxID=3364101 RepID=UPI00381E096B